jgi:hypothetical protein
MLDEVGLGAYRQAKVPFKGGDKKNNTPFSLDISKTV